VLGTLIGLGVSIDGKSAQQGADWRWAGPKTGYIEDEPCNINETHKLAKFHKFLARLSFRIIMLTIKDSALISFELEYYDSSFMMTTGKPLITKTTVMPVTQYYAQVMWIYQSNLMAGNVPFLHPCISCTYCENDCSCVCCCQSSLQHNSQVS
jgi:hypothetical protein